MNELDALRFYMALKLHFTSREYDLFRNNCHVANITPKALHSNRAREIVLRRLVKRFPRSFDLIQWLVSQYAYADTNAIYSPIESEENYQKWEKNRLSMSHIIIEDIDTLDDLVHDTPDDSDILEVIFKAILRGDIQLETAVAINKYAPFIETTKDYFPFDKLAVKIVKLARFVKYDSTRVIPTLRRRNEAKAAV